MFIEALTDRFHCLIAAAFAGLCTVTPALAAERVVLHPSQDNTLYETAMDTMEEQFELSNGAGNFIFSGRTGFDAGFKRRRAVLRFDLQAALPAGAEVLAAQLTLYQSKAAPGSPPANMGLYRVLQAWGEAGSKGIGAEGQGNFAEAGDVTWHHRLYPDELWDTAGGHFANQASATVIVGELLQDYSWQCTEELLADILYWQDNPAQNFGWIVVGGEEAGQSAHRFNSRENSNTQQRPRLELLYRLPGELFEDGFEATLSCAQGE